MWGATGHSPPAALEKAGYSELCRKFFESAAGRLSEEGYLFQHYNPDGRWPALARVLRDGKEVLPIQEDSTPDSLGRSGFTTSARGTWSSSGRIYETLILKSATSGGASRFRHANAHPSYDLWEERYGVHSYTVARSDRRPPRGGELRESVSGCFASRDL